MYTYRVPDMTCGHCEKAILNEIEDLDQKAEVKIDLKSKHVLIRSSKSSESLQDAIKKAGFAVEIMT